jgi:hypothetical protein
MSIEQYKRLQAVLGTTVDGIPGPKDEAAYKELRRLAQEERAKAVPSPVSSALGAAIVAATRKEVGVSEVTKNRAPEIAKYWEATDYPTGMENREPWCAAFVCWCIRQGIRDYGVNPTWALPRTATAFGFDDDWAVDNKLKVVRTPTSKDINPGDIVVFRFSHVGICVGKVNSDSILTVEGNTNGEGGREGDGVYQKIRDLKVIRSVVRIA